MTSPASLLPQWLRPATATSSSGAQGAGAQTPQVIGGIRAEPDDHTWATTNVRKHLFRASVRILVLLALDLLALITLAELIAGARHLPLLAWELGDLLRFQSSVVAFGSSGQRFATAMILSLTVTGS